MGRKLFIGDMHFGHANVLKFDNRPFESIEEHDAALIERWNKKVNKDDDVYVVGDMFWYRARDRIERVLKQLNGRVHLIVGNHDQYLHDNETKKLFASVDKRLGLTVVLEDGTEKHVVLSHFFEPFYDRHHYGAILLYAHSHKTKESILERQIIDFVRANEMPCVAYNVGCMYWDYEPVTLNEIIAAGEDKYR